MILFKDVSIPKPCTVDYDSLPYNEVKRFCNSCAKHVYDFRGKDEVYFNSIINTHGKVCGVFYEDEIKTSPILAKQSFYHTFTAKLIGVILFLKTLLDSGQAQASTLQIHSTTQQSIDSTGVKVEYKNEDNRYGRSYSIAIFINNIHYKSGERLDKGSGFVWLPDSLKPDDKIRIIVKEYDRRHNNKHRKKEYNFLFSDSEEITVKIKYHDKWIIFQKRRRRATAGYMYC